jgi:hypothetical protein
VMGLPLGTVKTFLHRGRLALRKGLAALKLFPGPDGIIERRGGA